MTYTGMFLSLLILIYDGYRGINRYLAGFLFFSSFNIYLQLIFAYSKNEALLTVFGVGFPTLYYLIGPFAYLYVRGMLLDRNQFHWRDTFHFLPLIIVIAGVLPFFLSSGVEERRELARMIMSDDWISAAGIRPNKLFSTLANNLLKAVQAAIYALLLWRLLYQHWGKLSGRLQGWEHRRQIRAWLLIFCSLFSLLVITRIVYSWVLFHAPSKSEFLALTDPFHVLAAIGFFGLNVALIAFPGILYGLPVMPALFRKKRPAADTAEIPGSEAAESEATDARNAQYFSADYLREIEAAIEDCVQRALYLEADWTLSRLALQLNIPEHHLSYYFNYVKQEKFIVWRKRLKIEFENRQLQAQLARLVQEQQQSRREEILAQFEKSKQEQASIEMLMSHFSKVYPGFTSALVTQYPKLSLADVQFCSLIRMNLVTKEISRLIHIEPRSIYIKKYRIMEKMGLGAGDDFEQIIFSLDQGEPL
jgi:AraC-like DNA-binding protein